MTWIARGLTVRFGSKVALDGIDLSIEPGAVHAVVGGDGAGKTTLLRVLAGIDLGAEGVLRLPAPGRTGYVPPSGGVFGDLTVMENLEFIADVYRLASWRSRGEELMARAGLASFTDRLAGKLSGGQRRKLAGSMALLPEPDLLVLDEVTTGVDPVSRMDLWRLITSAAASGAGVVIATGYLDEAERAGSVLLLHDGRALAYGTPQSILDAVPGSVESCESPQDRTRAWRHGRTWRQWDPAGTPDPDAAMTLEDAAIVAELAAAEVPR